MRSKVLFGIALIGLLLAATLANAQAAERPRASLGVTIDPSRRGPEQVGIVVGEVTADGPAAKAGLKNGDVIVKVEGKPVNDFESLVNILANHKPGDKLSVQVRRGGKEEDLSVTLGERLARRPRAPGGRTTAFLGVQTQPLTPELKSRFNTTADKGTIITEVVPNSPAARAGLQPGDVIARLDGKDISTPEELREAVHGAGPGKEVTVQVQRGADKKELKAKLEETPGDVGFGVPIPFPDGRPPLGRFPPVPDRQRIQQLEQRIEQLEKRVRDLEARRAETSKQEPK
jgi:S1-C subfamily serine protease